MSKSRGRRAIHRSEQSRWVQSSEIANVFQKAVTLHQQGQLAQAERSYHAVLRQAPNHAGAQRLLGLIECQRGNFAAAVQRIGQALKLNPKDESAHSLIAYALLQLNRYEEALASCDRALAIRPDYAEALNNRGLALLGLARHREALASYDRALAVNPDHPEALNNRGNVLLELRRHEEAAKDFERLVAVKPDWEYAQGNMLHSQLHCGDWKDYSRRVELIVKDVIAGKRVAHPFIFLSISESSRDQLQCARTFAQERYAASAQALWKGERYQHDRIRVAYLSADFHRHPVAYLMAGLFEAHDKSRFEITAISFGPDTKDDMRTRLENSFDRFIDVSSKSDHDVALLLKDLEIDIVLDLKGYTDRGRTGILAFRAAPIQVNFLGYPGTMGVDYIDYVLADRFVIPKDEHSFYAEKVVYLPDTCQPNDSKRRISEHTPTRADAGLPETGFVFCSFNDSHKITPLVFDVWMRLLDQVAGSVLWLLGDNAVAVRNLRHNAERRGVAPDRLLFAPRVNLEDHLARHRLAGFFQIGRAH